MIIADAASAMPVSLAATATAGTVAAPVAIPVQLELVAVIVASLAGVFAARERKLDLLGAVGLGAICGLGGGLLRDMILQVGDVYILRQPLALPLSIITAAVAFAFPRIVGKQDGIIALLDILSVGLYAGLGADKALVYGFEPTVAVTMGFFTAVGGGMLRDICLGQTPYIFQRSNFYAFAAIGGSITYVALVELTSLAHALGLTACVAVTVGLRYLSLHFDIMSPDEDDLRRMTQPIVRPIKTVAHEMKVPQQLIGTGGKPRTEGRKGKTRRRQNRRP